MKVFASIFAITAIAAAAATPDMSRRATTDLCGPLDTPQCCGTDVLGLADLSCSAGMSFLARIFLSVGVLSMLIHAYSPKHCHHYC
jgi:hypothetical protein